MRARRQLPLVKRECDMKSGATCPILMPIQLSKLLVKSGFRIRGANDRWFADQKNATAVFYGYDL